MDVAVAAVVVVCTMFVIVGRVMFQADRSGARGVVRARGRRDDYKGGDDSDTPM